MICKEVLSLYCVVICVLVFFVWRDERGWVWCDVICDFVRKEFEVG